MTSADQSSSPLAGDPLSGRGTEYAIPLSGAPLALHRLGRSLGVWRLRDWLLARAGRLVIGPGFYDPFEGPRVAYAMAAKLATDGRDHIEIDCHDFPSWLSPQLTSLPGYDPDYCFRCLYRSARAWRIDILDGESGIAFFGTPRNRRQMVFDIYFRRGVSPRLTSSQTMRFNERRRNLEVVTPKAIRDLYGDALSSDWSEYQP